MLEPSKLMVVFLELPYWAKLTLIIMAAVIGLMSSVLGTALRSRRKALARVDELTKALAEEEQKLASERRWRLADESVSARIVVERASRVSSEPPTPSVLTTPQPHSEAAVEKGPTI